MKLLLDLNNFEARNFFLKEESYFNFDLPKYFTFQNLLDKVASTLEGKRLSDFYVMVPGKGGKSGRAHPKQFEGVNYTLLNNKDGKYAWRPFQLLHPAIYVTLVNDITEEEHWNFLTDKFREFRTNPNIECVSIPMESETALSDKATMVSHWWHSIEQRSIELALEYEYVLHTDITDCYGSIYTHTIPWALHTKEVAKRERMELKGIGAKIDAHLQSMSYGQTNGIPQGSTLMDFIAEIVLGYADQELTAKIDRARIVDYQIIRYRDDYRVFVNNPQDADQISKFLTEILIDLGMRLNANKTLVSNNIITDSIKPDKLYWLFNRKRMKNLQDHLLLIHELSRSFPNSGSLVKSLTVFFNRIQTLEMTKQSIPVLVSILADIAFRNPKVYPLAAAIFSKLLSLSGSKPERIRLLESIERRFSRLANTGHLQLWLQRVTVKVHRDKTYEELLCKKIVDPAVEIWNSTWLNDRMRKVIASEVIVDEEIIDEIDWVIEPEEVRLFDSKSFYPY